MAMVVFLSCSGGYLADLFSHLKIFSEGSVKNSIDFNWHALCGLVS